MKIVGLNASPNSEGNTFFLLKQILSICEQNGAETEIIHIPKALSDAKTPFCVCCSSPCSQICYSGSLLEKAFDAVSAADAVIVGSPVYFGSMTAQLKAFFDKTRAMRAAKKWVGIPAGVVCVGASKYGGQEAVVAAVHSCMLVEGMTLFGPGSAEYDAGHLGVCAQQPAGQDEFAKTRSESMARRALQEAERHVLYRSKGV